MDKSCACATPVRIATYLRAIRPGGAEWPPCGLEFLTIRTVAIPGSTRANRHFEKGRVCRELKMAANLKILKY